MLPRPLLSVCAVCGRTFLSTTTDAKAVEAGRHEFPDTPPEDLHVVCEECYARYLAHLN
jgi:hypothetical protein